MFDGIFHFTYSIECRSIDFIHVLIFLLAWCKAGKLASIEYVNKLFDYLLWNLNDDGILSLSLV